MRTARQGQELRIEQARFVVYARARNTIYRVTGQYDWFLKLTRDGGAQPMEREGLGMSAIAGALSSHPLYQGAAVTRVSTKPAFVLASAIPGKPLNRLVLQECWMPGSAAGRRLEQTFARLGQLLATLHRDAVVGPALPSTTTRPFSTLEALLGRPGEPDAVVDALGVWLHAQERSDDGTAFQHGNFRLDNILRVGDQLGFIDLENCGFGTPWLDLSRPVSELLLTRSAAVYPRHRVTRCLVAFIHGYEAVLPVHKVHLLDHVRARLGRYYLEARDKGFRTRIGGVPVQRARLARLVTGTLSRDLDDVLAGSGR